jgi:hypothetical protein
MNKLLAVLILTASAFAAGVRKDISIYRDNGRPAGGATIRVCPDTNSGTVPCTPLQNVYYDQAMTSPKSNPVVADGLGNAFFYAPAGEYRLEVSGPGIATVRVYDDTPLVAGAGTGTGSVTSVGVSLGSDWTCSAPITTSGTITCSLSGTPTGTNVFVKSDSPVFGTKIFTPMIENGEVTAPGNPPAGAWRFYPKSGGIGFCEKNSAGTEYCISQNTSPLTAKGQLFGYSGSANVAVPVAPGDGYALVSDSTKTSGLGWSNATGGGGGTPTAPLPSLCMVNSTINFSNTATQHTLHSCAMNAGDSNVLGRILRIHSQGIVSTAGTGPTLNLAVVINGVITLQQTNVTLAAGLSNAGWSIDCDIVRTVTGTSGATSNYCTFRIDGTTANTALVDIESTASGNGTVWDATVAQTVAVKETFGTADPANSITSRYINMEQVNQ